MRNRFLRALRDDPRMVAVLVLGLGALAVLVTVGVVLVSRSAQTPADETAGRSREEPGEAAGVPPLPEITVDDLAVPDEGRRMEIWHWERFRTPGEPWSADEGDRFFVDPREPALDYLEARNDEEIKRILREVP
ncbi:MAG: hypothetical protein ACLFRR_10045 [Spirochaetaceae bacterium]